MLRTALTAIVDLLNDHIGVVPEEVILGSISMVDAFQDSAAATLTDRVIASVVNIEQESTLRNIPFRRTVMVNGTPSGVEQPPEIHLNVYVLFGANKSPANYTTALDRISEIIGFFQTNHVFTPLNTPALVGTGVDRLIADLHSTTFAELNSLWSINGGKYIPSVMYKLRMVIIQDAPEGEAPLVLPDVEIDLMQIPPEDN